MEAECLDRSHPNATLLEEAFLYYKVFLDGVFTATTVLTNAVLVVAIVQYRRCHKGSIKIYNTFSSMVFVVNLAVSDLLMALSVCLFLVTNYLCDVNEVFLLSPGLCLTRYVPSCFAQILSSLSLIAIAVDRYVAVFHAFQYKSIMTHRTCYAIISTVWLLASFSSFVLYFWNNWEEGSLCDLGDVAPVSYVVTLDSAFHFTVLAMVGGIHYKLHRKAVQSNSQRSSLGVLCPELPNNIKSARVLMLVVGVYVFCWAPYCVINIVDMLQKEYNPVVYYGLRLAYTFRNTYSFINPFIYAWRNREIQCAVKWFLHMR